MHKRSWNGPAAQCIESRCNPGEHALQLIYRHPLTVHRKRCAPGGICALCRVQTFSDTCVERGSVHPPIVARWRVFQQRRVALHWVHL